MSEAPLLEMERSGWTAKFSVAGFDGYLTCSEVDGKPIEIFIHCGKEGSTVKGLLNALAIAVSIGLRSGVDPKKYMKSLLGVQFEPQGYGQLGNRVGESLSLVDGIFQILADHYPELMPTDENKLEV